MRGSWKRAGMGDVMLEKKQTVRIPSLSRNLCSAVSRVSSARKDKRLLHGKVHAIATGLILFPFSNPFVILPRHTRGGP